uniref:Uncharacterized protein n=1 Tax=Coccidioides posadasii RMSCC 3488 TaxID=454284 RepID=A0A0J6FLM1_COCPO|nr:hypothetical protein CPAG_06083 [Coccidioides posadasii RMSCC 3488]
MAKQATGWRHTQSRRGRARDTLMELTAPRPTYQRVLGSAVSTTLQKMRQARCCYHTDAHRQDRAIYQRGVPNITDSDCSCGRGSQTLRHVLFVCPRFTQLREDLFGRVVGGPEGEGDPRKILTMPKLSIKAAKFMINTRLLGQFEAVNREDINKA